MDAVALILDGLRVVFGFLLVLFIPGFTLSLVYFPRSTDLRPIDRLIYSTVLSIGSVIVLLLIMEFVFGVNTTPRNIFLFICAFSVLSLILWHYEKRYLNNTFKIPFKIPLDRLYSWDYHALLKYYSRIVNSVGERFRKNSMTKVIYHEYLVSGGNHIDHSCLIDTGEEIEIQQIIEYSRKACDCVLLTPPYPRTRYFELFIREYVEDEMSRIDDMQVYPVLAFQKKPAGKIPGFLLHTLNWKITERLYKQSGTTKIQWIYHHDFGISAISHPGDAVDSTIDRVIAKIDEITTSIKSGSPVTSYIEGHLMRRKTFLAEMKKYGGISKTRVEIGPAPEFHPLDELDERDCRKLEYEILRDLTDLGITLDTFGSQKFKEKFKISKKTDINQILTDIDEIYSLNDLYE
jgi:hypothetical protein